MINAINAIGAIDVPRCKVDCPASAG